MKIAIISHIKSERDKLISVLNKWFASQKIPLQVSVFTDDTPFMERDAHTFDSIFIDCDAEAADAVETLRFIRKENKKVPIVFLTAGRENIFEAVHLHIFDYILKPYTAEQVWDVLSNLSDVATTSQPNRFLEFTSGKKNISLQLSDILYITADNNYTVFTMQKSVKRYRIFFSNVYSLLNDERFLLCTRGVAVNMDYIEKEKDSTFEMKDGRKFPIHRNGRRQVIDAFERYRLQKSAN